VFTPTADVEIEIKEIFYDQLISILAEVPKRDTKILMGDLNAKVGSKMSLLNTL
jgi:hypothetical protein